MNSNGSAKNKINHRSANSDKIGTSNASRW